MKLTLGDFKREGLPGSFQHYFTHSMPDGKEVCLEACAGGYCVAIYDAKQEILTDKVCTDLPGMLEAQIMPGFSMGTGEALIKAVAIANKLIATV